MPETISRAPRSATVSRSTKETNITITVTLDGTGISSVNSGVVFLDHMLTNFSKHSGFDLALECRGDLEVDDHHTVEDVALVLGNAIAEALGEKRGIQRY